MLFKNIWFYLSSLFQIYGILYIFNWNLPFSLFLYIFHIKTYQFTTNRHLGGFSFCHYRYSCIKILLTHWCTYVYVYLYHKVKKVELVNLNVCAYFISIYYIIQKWNYTHVHVHTYVHTHAHTTHTHSGLYSRHTNSEIQDVMCKNYTMFKIIFKYIEDWK